MYVPLYISWNKPMCYFKPWLCLNRENFLFVSEYNRQIHSEKYSTNLLSNSENFLSEMLSESTFTVFRCNFLPFVAYAANRSPAVSYMGGGEVTETRNWNTLFVTYYSRPLWKPPQRPPPTPLQSPLCNSYTTWYLIRMWCNGLW